MAYRVKPEVSVGEYPGLAKLTTSAPIDLDQPRSVYPARVETGALAIVPAVTKLPGSTAEPDCES